jgi:FixJ family two-component response regulator
MITGAREFRTGAHPVPRVILDLNLPGLNGLELQQALAERGLGEQIIFIGEPACRLPFRR